MRIDPKIIHAGLVSYCLLIFILSSIPGDNFPEVKFEFSDKIVHLIIYAILYSLFFYSLNNQVKSVKLQKFSPEFALLFTSLYGLSDEAHQYFVPNRSCEFYDWIADVAGGLAVYFVIKYHRSRVKVISVLFLAVILGGCTSSERAEQKSKIDISFSETDCWLNLMPMVNDNKNVLGFLISLNVEANSSDLNYSVKDLKIYMNNDTIQNKELSVEIFEASENLIKINISQNNRTIYLDRNKEYPEEAEFHFAIYKDNKKIRSMKTSKIKINKVY